MNYLSFIHLNNFRNLENQQVDLCNNSNILIGTNGSGKTNFLESISLLEPGKGFRKNSLDKMKKFKQNSPWIIRYKYNDNNTLIDISATYDQKKNDAITKKIFINGNKEKKLSSLKMTPNIIWYTPEMQRLFQGPSLLRRNFIDRIVYSFDSSFLHLINNYTKYIRERSFIIRGQVYDQNWLNNIEKDIAKLGIEITRKRNESLNILNMMFNKISSKINDMKKCRLLLSHDFDKKILKDEKDEIFEEYINKLKNSREEDKIKGGCRIGPHKSDIEVLYSRNNLNATYCSTGQQKEIILNIIFCQCNYLINKFQKKPIILLDEICSHIDENTRLILLNLVEWLKVQVLMTGTDKNLFSFLSTKSRFFDVKNGIIKLL